MVKRVDGTDLLRQPLTIEFAEFIREYALPFDRFVVVVIALITSRHGNSQ